MQDNEESNLIVWTHNETIDDHFILDITENIHCIILRKQT